MVRTGFDFYAVKDRGMADTVEYGLMLWDGKSTGTINNVVNLARKGKPVVVSGSSTSCASKTCGTA